MGIRGNNARFCSWTSIKHLNIPWKIQEILDDEDYDENVIPYWNEKQDKEQEENI